MIAVLKTHRITAFLVLAAVFLLFLSVSSFSTSDPEYEETRIAWGIVTGLGALAFLGVLFVRRRRARQA